METATLLWFLAFTLIVTGLVGLVLPAIPGALLVFAGLFLAAWAEDFTYVGTWTIVALAVLAAHASRSRDQAWGKLSRGVCIIAILP